METADSVLKTHLQSVLSLREPSFSANPGYRLRTLLADVVSHRIRGLESRHESGLGSELELFTILVEPLGPISTGIRANDHRRGQRTTPVPVSEARPSWWCRVSNEPIAYCAVLYRPASQATQRIMGENVRLEKSRYRLPRVRLVAGLVHPRPYSIRQMGIAVYFGS